MKQAGIILGIVFALFSTSVASAQVSYTGTCGTTYTRALAVGSRGNDVRQLQSFLVSQNYPGGGSWMITGYFGTATQAALRIYQQTHGLAQTGMFDAATRASVSGCGSYTYPYGYNYNYNYNYPFNNQYPYQYGAVSISSLSVTSAAPGASVTVYGSGFDYSNNTVYVGNMPIANLPSYYGNAISFVVPSYLSGQVQVYVTNTRGTSNALTLSIVGSSYPCGTYQYYGSCPQGGMPTISSLSPQSGAVGSTVTVFGTGFTTTGNSVRFGQGVITNLNSIDGRSISFTVPSQLTGYGSAAVYLGTYNVSVTNAAGYTSNALPFTVTSLGSASSPSISGVTGPTTLGLNVTGTWTIQVNSYGSNYVTTRVTWGDEGYYGASQPVSNTVYGTQTLTFTHAYAQAGTYTVIFTVTNAFGQQSTASATVVVSGSGSSQVSLNNISPTSGRVGTQIQLNGSGFTSYENTVHFGVGGTQHLPSYNGTTIYYTVPQYVSPCDVITAGQYCATYAQQVTPGAYQIYVTNANGTTNQLTFTVTQ